MRARVTRPRGHAALASGEPVSDDGRTAVFRALATYAEALDRGTGERYRGTRVPADGRRRVGAPTAYWEGRPSYYRSVYVQGAAMLLEARAAAGAAAFDRAVACHVRRHAHAVTTPDDLRASLRHLPRALEVLRRYGALPPDGAG